MKRYFSAIVIFLLLAVVSACSDDKEPVVPVAKPGVYTVEMSIDVSTTDSQSLTRGVTGNNNFDTNYDPDYIYLHIKGSDDALRLPVYAYSCDLQGDCNRGFRYQIEVMDDGSAVVTVIDEDYNYGDSLTIPAGSSCYFSSIETNEWGLPDGQVSDRGSYTFYQRKNDINKEIYRSENDYTVAELAENNDEFPIVRACAGFNLVGLFYDANDVPDVIDPDMTYPPIILTEDEFADIMGSASSTWYIKIFIGGDSFSNKYDLGEQVATGDRQGGYYSSGDSQLFDEGVADANKFLPLSYRNIGFGEIMYYGFGYYTRPGNQLFTPVTGDAMSIYVLIKHWSGEGQPSEEWLLDDTNALYTKVDLSGTTNPVNNKFYIMGLMMDIRQFKAAWNAAGGDAAAGTRAVSGPREFTIEGAKVVCEAY